MFIMNKRNLRAVDLNLLVVLDSIIEEKHITNAAKKLNLTQSALSKTLSRIRNMFDDPILVRMQNGYELTDRAQKLAEPIKKILQDVDEVIAPINFDPATTEQWFSIGTLDFGEVIAGNEFMRQICEKAPKSKIRFIPRTILSNSQLFDGAVDMLFRVRPEEVPQNCIAETIIEDKMVCIVDSNHPTAGKKLTLDDYLNFPHSALHVGIDEPIIDKTLAKIGKKRNTLKQSSNFVALAFSILNTPMILTVPNSAAQTLKQLLDISVHDLPFQTPPLDMVMIWHKRNQDRPDHKWFRNEFKKAFLKASGI